MITQAQAQALLDLHLPWIVDFAPWAPVPGSAINGFWVPGDSDDRLYRGSFDSPGSNANFIEWPVVLGAGTWTLMIMGVKYSDSGIMTCSLNGSTIGTIDMYDSGIVVNNRGYVADFNVATSGKKAFRIATATKNASSSSYVVRLQYISFTRTA